MTTTGSGSTHKGLSINIYRVDGETHARTPIKECILPPLEELEPVSILAFPPCRCPRCRNKAGHA
ncbi:hypothetical protein [Streptomyces enissocaesilis]|uniref:Uncharacterized protein n=1 Tax=Streptomyces enissocaesilis TaxID=332589 RepID=A0ABN3XQ33_9ACTN